mmetsp:Transcript_9486/g.21761  ORF Transcript_9486/g.21761 Transcript_9486/m.21761 type:complete len:107 (-) Transcript_9486:355-675(-)
MLSIIVRRSKRELAEMILFLLKQQRCDSLEKSGFFVLFWFTFVDGSDRNLMVACANHQKPDQHTTNRRPCDGRWTQQQQTQTSVFEQHTLYVGQDPTSSLVSVCFQ